MTLQRSTKWVMAGLTSAAVLLSACSSTPSVAPSPSPVAQAAASVAPVVQGNVYTNAQYGFSVEFPEGWEKKEGIAGTVVAFLSPQEGETDKFRENVNITVQAIPEGQSVTLDEYNKLSRDQIKQLITSSKEVSNTKTTLAGEPAYSLVYTGKQGQYALQWQSLYSLANGKAYVVTYTAEPAKYEAFKAGVDQIVQSFAMSK